jgi:radical SAM superfamily enzyme YgiQ (UPF0313 family)
MNVLLINPSWIRSDENLWKKVGSCVPSIGLAYIAAVLEHEDIKVEILDCNAEKNSLKKLPEKLSQYNNQEFIGITATTSIVENAIKTAEICKKKIPKSKIVMGGVHPTVLPNEVLSNKYVDFVVRGEGEYTMLELVKGKKLKEILGLSYKQNGEIIHNSFRPLIKDLDKILFPAYHLLPMDKYFPAVGSYKRLPAMSTLATRGCPGRCTFCYRMFGNKARTRSARNIINEIKLLINNYGIKEICFYDDVFTLFKKNVKEFCSIIIDEKIDITWSCFSRVDFVDEEMLSVMKKAGCHQIMYGIESGDEQILNGINKKTPFEKIEKAIFLTKKVGIDTRGAFMLGNPGETEETMKKTIDFAIKLDLDLSIFNITTPYPGTEMYYWAKENGYLNTEDWSKYDLSYIVMDLPTVDHITLKRYYKLAYRRFYLRPRYWIKRLLKIRTLTDLKADLKSFLSLIGGF